jgi:hypothetical protein
MTFLTNHTDFYCTSVNITLSAHYYPLDSGGLDGWYIGVGSGGDFMHYFGSGAPPENSSDILLSIIPQSGWKIQVLPYLMVDMHAGYKVIVRDAENYTGIKDYIGSGFQAGFNIKFSFRALTRGAA